MISKIKIKEYGILKDTELECKKFNLIFGYNGSGKTTLTRIFKEISENNINSDKYTIEYPDSEDLYIKVYSGKDYLNENFQQNIDPISFNLGKENIELKNRLKELSISFKENKDKIDKLKSDLENVNKDYEDIHKSISKNVVKDLHLKTQEFTWNKSEKFYLSNNNTPKELNDNELCELSKEFVNINDIHSINKINLLDINIYYKLFKKIESILNKKFDKIDFDDNIFKEFLYHFETKENDIFRKWVIDGIDTDIFENKKCPFCFRPLDKLYDCFVKYFSEDIKNTIAFLNDCKEKINKLSYSIDSLYENIDVEKFYIDERNNIQLLITNMLTEIQSLQLNEVLFLLDEKINDIYANRNYSVPDFVEKLKYINEIIENINLQIDKHNETVSNTKKIKENYIVNIAMHYIYFEKDKLDTLKSKKNNYTNLINECINDNNTILEEIKEIESQINNIQIPIDEFNTNLHNFLGRKDISIKFDDTSKEYKIMREKDDIKNYISEGEKTAICIVHFLVSLKDNKYNRSKENCIVVIDDPISSLDSNYLYNLYSFLHANLQDVEQLFIITHHFYFFRRVYNWFSNIRDKNYKKVKPSIKEIKRDNYKFLSKIDKINEYFENYESEYQYLYSELQKFKDLIKNKSKLEYEEIILLPNMCRRIFESILSFLDPFDKHDRRVFELLNSISDVNVKEKLLYIYRYTNTESHHQAFDLYDIYQKNTDEAVKLIDAMFAIIDEISENQLNSYNRHLNKQNKN
ncbi:AAA family ATPase [Brachyspira pulli]|uniref:AAA family ATPase n=1 Tax=Brachyspira pulli TaxID=310721 RepID=UPI003004447C